jgi:hypothetical protein
MPASIQDLFSFNYLMDVVNEIESGLPQTVPNEFWTIKQNVIGDRIAIPLNVGSRNLPKMTPYMSPAVQAKKYDLSMKTAVCMAFNEVMEFGQELTTLYRNFADYGAQSNRALDLVALQTKNFKQKFDNMRIAAVGSVLARDGKIYYDVDGNMLPTSSGASWTFDNQVPAGNVGNPGSIFSTWNTSADIPTQVLNFKSYALRQTGKAVTTAYYGPGVSGRLANNTNFQYYLARNPQYNEQFKNTGQIADGVLGLKWVPVQDTYFVDQNDTAQTLFRTDYITFAPDLKGNYVFLEGTTPVHPDANNISMNDVPAAMRGIKEVSGIGSYSEIKFNPLQLKQYMFDAFAPVILTPNSWYWVNVG